MNVRELMTSEVLTVTPETPLKDVAAILSEHGISGLPVCDEQGSVLGVVSEGDILFKEQGHRERHAGALARLLDGSRRHDAAKQAALTAGDAMTAPALTITSERPVSAAARLMLDHAVNRLPVVDGGVLLGIVTRADLVRAFTRADEEIAAEIREDVLRRALWLQSDAVQVTVTRGAVALAGELATRSDVEVLKKLVQRVPGVVSVSSRVLWRVDDLQRTALRA